MNYKRKPLAAEDETARANNLNCYYVQLEIDTFKEYLDISDNVKYNKNNTTNLCTVIFFSLTTQLGTHSQLRGIIQI